MEISKTEKMRRWRLANPERNKELSRLSQVRYLARRSGKDVETAIVRYLERKAANQLIPDYKICTKCKAPKPLTDFANDARRKWGVSSQCKACKRQSEKAWAAKNRDYLATLARKRYRTKPDVREKSHARSKTAKFRRKTRMKTVTADLTASQWFTIKAAYKHCCAYCGLKKPLTQDHVVPISQGGHHTAANIVPACRSCNSSKGPRLPQTIYQPHLIA